MSAIKTFVDEITDHHEQTGKRPTHMLLSPERWSEIWQEMDRNTFFINAASQDRYRTELNCVLPGYEVKGQVSGVIILVEEDSWI
jgi:hypothetical protein